MTPAQRLKTSQDLYETAWAIKTAWLRKQHPGWTDDQVHDAVREIFLYART